MHGEDCNVIFQRFHNRSLYTVLTSNSTQFVEDEWMMGNNQVETFADGFVYDSLSYVKTQ